MSHALGDNRSATSPDNRLGERLDALQDLLRSEDFLRSRGLSNESNIRIFPYEPARELEIRAWVVKVATESAEGRLMTPEATGARLHARNLWEMFVSVLEDELGEGYQEALEEYAEEEGREALVDYLADVVSAEDVVRAMDWPGHEVGDVLLLHGVGMAYPFVRLHQVLENVQLAFGDVPTLALYPGVYTGHSLVLFGKLDDGNYYRAFKTA